MVPKTKKTAKEVIANTTKENADKWLQDQSEDEDTPPPDSTLVGTASDPGVKDEIQEEVAVAEAREEGIVGDQPPAQGADPSPLLSDHASDDDHEIEQVVPTRSIRFRVKPPVVQAEPETKPEPKSRSSRRGKRKEPSPVDDDEEEPAPKQPKSGRSIRIKAKPQTVSTPTPTRSLRSRAPKTEEKQQADRAARARIRAALSEDVELEDEEDIDMDM